QDVSAELLQQFNLFEQYAAAAYCEENFNSTGTKLTCSAGNCPLVEAADTKTIDEFTDSSYGNVTGFLAVDNTNKLIVLSFRGTRSIDTWISNLDFTLKDIGDICSGCEIHNGFWKSWNSVSDDLTSRLQSTVSEYPDYAIIFTGHSAGAAVATVGTLVLRKVGYAVDLYPYGCPRIGNGQLAEYMTTQTPGTNYRITHTDDIVPRLPPEWAGYSHYSPEYWITSPNNVTVTTADIQVIQGIDSDAGNAGTDGLSTDAHGWYFGPISACQ
ncbi:putative extracellular lipase, partial [Thermoascus aurantiacus ATCC 26904]